MRIYLVELTRAKNYIITPDKKFTVIDYVYIDVMDNELFPES